MRSKTIKAETGVPGVGLYRGVMLLCRALFFPSPAGSSYLKRWLASLSKSLSAARALIEIE